MERRALVVHASDLLAKGYVAVPTGRRDDDGEPTNALFGVTRAIRQALSFKTPDIAVAVIADEVPGGWPDELRAQVPALTGLLEAHGIHVVAAPEPEHVVASYVRASLEAGYDVVVAGSDKRLAQLVGPDVWWYDGYKDARYTPEMVYKRFGVGPEKVAGWLALVGDDDALSGVPGIGKKGATDLIEAHGSVDAAIGGADDIEGRAGKALRAGLDEARRQLDIAVLRTDVPLPVALDELAYAEPTVETLNGVYGELGFYRLLAVDDEAEDVSYVICASEDDVAAALDALGTGAAALQALIEDPSPPRGDLVGLAVSGGSGRAFYIPFAGEGPTVDPLVLGPWLADPGRPKVGHDVKAAVIALARRGIQVRGIVGDSALASHLADPSGSAPHELQGVARVRLRKPVQSDVGVRSKGASRKPWAGVAVGDAGELACHWADLAGQLWRFFEPTVQRDLLDEHLALCETLMRMELAGMPVDDKELAIVGEDFDAGCAEIEARVQALAGKEFNLGSTKQLGAVLFEDLGLPVLSRTKTGWSTATAVLERLEGEHPVVPLIIKWRMLRRLRDTWVTALSTDIDSDGRVRSTFHPARSFSGRLVNSDPDLGRVPGRTPEMARIRRAFRAPRGHLLLSVDYDQLGLYVLAHLTRDPALVDPLSRGEDMHTATAAAVLDLAPAEVGPRERQIGKVVNFATFAGQGASALAMQLDVNPAEAKKLIARFDQRYAVVRAFQEEQLRLARERGWIETIAGRHWPIGGLTSLDPQALSYAERLARRATHEGSVADVSRRGLLRADQALRDAGLRAFPLLQVHDEVLFEVPEGELDEAARVTAEAMRDAWDLVVPLRVGCKAGPNWADLERL